MEKITDLNNYKEQLLTDFNSRTNYDNGRFYIPVANKLVEFANLQHGQVILYQEDSSSPGRRA